MKLSKYFWDLNPQSLKETVKALKDPNHPKFLLRAITILSRCDDPKKLFAVIDKNQFIENWPRIRRFWNRTMEAQDFKAWWETIYERLIEKRKIFKKPKGEPTQFLKDLGAVIRRTRIEKGLSQLDLAQLSSIGQPDVSAIEKGFKNMTLGTTFRICKVLGIQNLSLL